MYDYIILSCPHRSYHIWRLCFMRTIVRILPHSQIDMSTFDETWCLRFIDIFLLFIVQIHQNLPDYPFCTCSNLMFCFWLRLNMNREKAVPYSSSQSGMFECSGEALSKDCKLGTLSILGLTVESLSTLSCQHTSHWELVLFICGTWTHKETQIKDKCWAL